MVPPTRSTDAWLSRPDAAKALGSSTSYIGTLSRRKKIRRKRFQDVPGRYVYSKADVLALAAEREQSKLRSKPQSEASLPLIRVTKAATSPALKTFEVHEVSTRMPPKTAQTAVQKARWVFEGVDMGVIATDDALGLLRNVLK